MSEFTLTRTTTHKGAGFTVTVERAADSIKAACDDSGDAALNEIAGALSGDIEAPDVLALFLAAPDVASVKVTDRRRRTITARVA